MKHQTRKASRQPLPSLPGQSVTGACLLALVFLSGCASSTAVSNSQQTAGKIPKPNQIWVYNFVATPAGVPADSVLAGQAKADTAPQTAEQIAEGNQLGAEIAAQLVADIHKLGKPAALATADTKPQLNDLVIRGYLVSVQEGSATKRVAIGFGSGASELRTVVEGYQMRADGLQKLGSGTVEAEGSKAPGVGLGLAGFAATHNPAGLIISSGMKIHAEKSGSSTVDGRAKQTAQEIADQLDKRFRQHGWVN